MKERIDLIVGQIVDIVGLVAAGSLLDVLRPKASSQPAAASLPQAIGALLGRSAAGALDQAHSAVTGVTALWLGDYRF